jgi:hypothetical protein
MTEKPTTEQRRPDAWWNLKAILLIFDVLANKGSEGATMEDLVSTVIVRHDYLPDSVLQKITRILAELLLCGDIERRPHKEFDHPDTRYWLGGQQPPFPPPPRSVPVAEGVPLKSR